jgi:hypothetical protein
VSAEQAHAPQASDRRFGHLAGGFDLCIMRLQLFADETADVLLPALEIGREAEVHAFRNSKFLRVLSSWLPNELHHRPVFGHQAGMKLELDGRTCLVSGASAGIGAVIPVDGGMRHSAT